MRVSPILLALTATVLSGCAVPQQIRFTKDGTDQAKFMKDRYECLQEAQQRVSGAYVNQYGGASSSKVVANCGVWVACLGARGYEVDPNGDLAAPPGMVVYCAR